MPIHCQLEVRSLSAEEFTQLDYRVMGHAFASQNELGRLCDEGVYERDLQARLLAGGFQDVQIEVPVHVSHKTFSKTYFLDLVADHAVYELKTVAALAAEHQAQLLNYLFLLGIPRGKLLNFRTPQVQGRIHATPLSAYERRQFQLDSTRWQDRTPQCVILRETLQELLTDWGAFLDFRLYQEALTHFLGEERVMQRLALQRQHVPLGTQEFHVHAPATAFRVTAVTDQVAATESHLRRLLALTELQTLQWINLRHAEIQLVTLCR